MGFTPGSLSIVDTVGQVQTCNVKIPDPLGNKYYEPHDAISITSGAVNYFSGTVDISDCESLESPYAGTAPPGASPVGARMWAVSAQGWSLRAFTTLTTYVYAQRLTLIQTTVEALAAGLGVDADVSAGALEFPDTFTSELEPISDALDRLADLCTHLSGTPFVWKIKGTVGDLTLVFAPVTTLLGPGVGSGGRMPKANPPAKLRKTRENFANSVLLKLDRYLVDGGREQVETFEGLDIFLGALTLEKPLAGQPIITVDGVDETVGIQGSDTGKDWYFSLGSRVVTQGDSSGGDEIVIRYVAHDLRYIDASDASSIAAVGLFQRPTMMPDTGSVMEPQSQANAELARHNGISEILTCVVPVTSVVFESGTLIPVSITGYGPTGTQAVAGYFYCRSARTFDEDGVKYWTQLDLIRGPFLSRAPGALRRALR